MDILGLIVVIVVLFNKLIKYEPPHKRIAKRDADPTNTVKSNMWYKQHKENIK